MKIEDKSSDKKYFTIIPNYILNHSTIYDREVYMQMKRITGDNGTCYCSQATLAKQCGISINRLKKSIKYLLNKNWIKKIGEKKVKSSGGKQKTNEYKLTDLWRINSDYYSMGVSPDDTPSDKGVSPDDTKGYHQMTPKGYHQKATKKNQYKEEPIKKNNIAKSNDFAGKINNLFDLFYKVNPVINYANKTQRNAMEELLKKIGYKRVFDVTRYALKIQGEKYAPVVSTPSQLKNKWGDLAIYYKKKSSSKKTINLNL